MFQNIVLRSSSKNGPVTAGELAEALLYYQSVHVILDRPSFFSLARGVGINELAELIKDGHISASFSPEMLGAYSQASGDGHLYRLLTVSSAGDDGVPKKLTKREALREMVSWFEPNKKHSRRIADNLSQLLPLKKYSIPRRDFGIFEAAYDDMTNSMKLGNIVSSIFQTMVPNFDWSTNYFFRINYVDHDYFVVDTNLPFAKSPSAPTIVYSNVGTSFSRDCLPTVGALLFELLGTRADLNIALHYMSEFRTNEVRSLACSSILTQPIERSNRSAENLARFQYELYEDVCALAEAINSGQRNFSDFMRAYDKSVPHFKSWLSKIDPDADLIAEYFKEVHKKPWFDKMPGKVVRFASMGTFDLIADGALELASETFDSFFLEKLIKGWRPNHFVDGPLRKFLEGRT